MASPLSASSISSSLNQLSSIETEISNAITDFSKKSKGNVGTSLTQLPIHLTFDTVAFPYQLLDISTLALEKLKGFIHHKDEGVKSKAREIKGLAKSTQHAARQNIAKHEVFVPFLQFYRPIYENTRALQDQYSTLYQVVFDPSKLTLLPKAQEKDLVALQKETTLLKEQLELARKTLNAYQKKINPPDPVVKMIATEQHNLNEMLEVVEVNLKIESFSQFYYPHIMRVYSLREELVTLLKKAIDPKTKKLIPELTRTQAIAIKEKYDQYCTLSLDCKTLLKNLRKKEDTPFEVRDHSGLETHILTRMWETLQPKIKLIDEYLAAPTPIVEKTKSEPKELVKRVTIKSSPDSSLQKTQSTESPPPTEEHTPAVKENLPPASTSFSCIEKIRHIWNIFTRIIQWILSGCKTAFPSFAMEPKILKSNT